MWTVSKQLTVFSLALHFFNYYVIIHDGIIFWKVKKTYYIMSVSFCVFIDSLSYSNSVLLKVLMIRLRYFSNTIKKYIMLAVSFEKVFRYFSLLRGSLVLLSYKIPLYVCVKSAPFIPFYFERKIVNNSGSIQPKLIIFFLFYWSEDGHSLLKKNQVSGCSDYWKIPPTIQNNRLTAPSDKRKSIVFF